MHPLPTSEKATPDLWIPGVRRNAAADSTVRLICFPFAGAGASAFHPWRGRNGGIQMHAVQYPGRETRWGEVPFDTLEAMIDALAAELARLWSGAYAFWGHSLGALIAFELTRRLRSLGHVLPRHLFVSGARAPHLPPKEPIHHLPDREFLAKLTEYGGMQPEVLQNDELLSAVLPTIRNDFRLLEQYTFRDAPPFPVALSAFGGLQDENVSVGDLLAWSIHTCTTFRPRFLAGDHFFHLAAADEMWRYIREDA
jgi:medium-chain acyl-[acyl-carrier-protein] hydrolase